MKIITSGISWINGKPNEYYGVEQIVSEFVDKGKVNPDRFSWEDHPIEKKIKNQTKLIANLLEVLKDKGVLSKEELETVLECKIDSIVED